MFWICFIAVENVKWGLQRGQDFNSRRIHQNPHTFWTSVTGGEKSHYYTINTLQSNYCEMLSVVVCNLRSIWFFFNRSWFTQSPHLCLSSALSSQLLQWVVMKEEVDVEGNAGASSACGPWCRNHPLTQDQRPTHLVGTCFMLIITWCERWCFIVK